MQVNNITKLLGLKGIKVINFEEFDTHIEFSTVFLKREKRCCNCHSRKIEVFDHKIQKIKDIPIKNKPVIIKHKNTRYKCRKCGKKFTQEKEFVSRNCKITSRLRRESLFELKNMVSVKYVSKKYFISPTTIFNFLKKIRFERLKLSTVLNIDEFKGDSGCEKYQTIICDSKEKKIIDIIETRKKETLDKYFKNIPKEEKDAVSIFVSDMYRPFKDIRDKHFTKSVHVIDRYHFVRQVSWAFDNIRIAIQEKLERPERIHFKRSKSLLLKPQIYLTSEEKIKAAIMLERNDNLRKAYFLKEAFYVHVMSSKTKEEAKINLLAWVELAKETKMPEWNDCIKAFTNWIEEISNSFEYDYTNAFTEGTNCKIKGLKRLTFSMPNFENFRNRILALA